jgi:branched-chain amino acid transport system substrate-binding protein
MAGRGAGSENQRCAVTRIRGWFGVGLMSIAGTGFVGAQSSAPAPSLQSETRPYANMPPTAAPYGGFVKPYQEWYVEPDTLEYDGAARDEADGNAATLKTINLGFLGPLDAANEDSVYGTAMLHGAQMAVDEANARGGYRGKPFALKVHDDLPLWGASSLAVVQMRYQDEAWAMLGSVDSASTHIEVRATLKLEMPIMDTATNDPTVTETRVPWLIHNFPDDRQQGYALADYIFLQRHLKRIGILQVNNRYGRAGKEIFFETARRIGHQPVAEVWYAAGSENFTAQLNTLAASGIDGLVIWGNAAQAGLIVKQMRGMGMQQPVFGSSRICTAEVMKVAGAAAEGMVVVSAIDPTRDDVRWTAFRKRFTERFDAEPDAYAAYAFDGATMMMAAIDRAGLNRGRIMDALRGYEMKEYAGVSGNAQFDFTLNNIAPVTMAQVRAGRFVYWPEQRTDWKTKSVANAR